jgi:hypothetical protein
VVVEMTIPTSIPILLSSSSLGNLVPGALGVFERRFHGS